MEEDLDDFDACINNQGFSNKAACLCPNSFEFIGATAVGAPANTTGFPDGNGTDLAGNNAFNYSTPFLEIGVEICLGIGFNNGNGLLSVELNGDYSTIRNPSGNSNNAVQEFCFPVTVAGTQSIRVYEEGDGSIFIDGVYFSMCPCDAAGTCDSCDSASNVSVTNITQNSARVSFTGDSNSNSFVVVYREENEADWSIQHSTNEIVTLSDLSSCGDYHFKVLSDCSAGFLDERTVVHHFSTLESNNCDVECELTEILGLNFVSSNGVGNGGNSNGLPDNNYTGNVNGINDVVTLSAPFLSIGDEICVFVSFFRSDGAVSIDLNGQSFVVTNPGGLAGYVPRKICFPVTEAGIQIVSLRDAGASVLRVDGAHYERCRDIGIEIIDGCCLLYTSPSPRDQRGSRMPSSA